MKGTVFTELLPFVEQIHGEDAVDDLVDACDLPSGGANTAVGTYDHTEMQALVAALSCQSNTPPNELLEVFGQHLIRASGFHSTTSKAAPTLFDILESIDWHIHVEHESSTPMPSSPNFAPSASITRPCVSTIAVAGHSRRWPPV